MWNFLSAPLYISTRGSHIFCCSMCLDIWWDLGSLTRAIVPLSLQYSVTAFDGMTTNSVISITIRMHPTHLQCTQLSLINYLESFQDIDIGTHPWCTYSTINIRHKSELVYPPTSSFDPSPNISSILLKSLRMFSQQSSTHSLDTTDIYLWQSWYNQFKYFMVYDYAREGSRPLFEISIWNAFSIRSLYLICECENTSIQLHLSL